MSATCWSTVPAPDDEYGAFGGMRICRGNQSTRRKPATVPLCPPQTPHDLTWDRTRAAAVGSRRLTACAVARAQNEYLTIRPEQNLATQGHNTESPFY
jgi:hypothetical protein